MASPLRLAVIAFLSFALRIVLALLTESFLNLLALRTESFLYLFLLRFTVDRLAVSMQYGSIS